MSAAPLSPFLSAHAALAHVVRAQDGCLLCGAHRYVCITCRVESLVLHLFACPLRTAP